MYNLDKITRRVKVMIGGREYALAFSLSSLQELEKYLGNINTLFTRGEIPTLNELVTAFWIALKGGGQNMEKKDAESLIASFCRTGEADRNFLCYFCPVWLPWEEDLG